MTGVGRREWIAWDAMRASIETFKIRSFEDRSGMESLSHEMTRQPIDIFCPSCGYSVWVVWAEVAAGVSVMCPCCHVRIRLVDESGSVQTAPERVQAALQSLETALRGISS